MKNITLYTVLTYTLFPFAAFLALGCLGLLAVALMNPALLLPLFMMLTVVIYTVCSFIFLQKGIKQAKPCNASLKDWIKVNAYVAIAFSTLMLVQSIGILAHPVQLKELLEDSLTMQKTALPPQVSFGMLLRLMKGTLIIMTFFSVVLTIHIFLTFRLVKLFNYVFDKE